MNPYIVIQPVITEKSVRLANVDSIFTFKVQNTATKEQVKEAVEKLFSVDVLDVRTIVNQKSKRRTGKKRVSVVIAKSKKALVTLKAGQNIDLFDISEK